MFLPHSPRQAKAGNDVSPRSARGQHEKGGVGEPCRSTLLSDSESIAARAGANAFVQLADGPMTQRPPVRLTLKEMVSCQRLHPCHDADVEWGENPILIRGFRSSSHVALHSQFVAWYADMTGGIGLVFVSPPNVET